MNMWGMKEMSKASTKKEFNGEIEHGTSVYNRPNFDDEGLLWGRMFRAFNEVAETQKTYARLILLNLIITMFVFVLVVMK